MPTSLRALVALAFFLVSAPAHAEPDEKPFLMGITHYTPSTMKGADGQWTGTCADAWKRVAEEIGLKFEFKEIDFKQIMAKGPEGLGVDGIACVIPSPRSEKIMDTSKPHTITGLGIATRPEAQSGVKRVLDKMLSWKFMRNILILIAIIVIAGILVWRVERSAMPEDFGGSALKGIGNGAFWSFEALLAKPRPLSKRLRSRIVTLFWIVASMLLISGVTASLSAEFTVNKLTGEVSGAKDLPRVRVGVGVGAKGAKSNTSRYLDSKGIRYQTFVETPKATGVELALAELDRGELDAVIGAAVELQYLVNHNYSGKLLVLPEMIQPSVSTFGIRRGHPRRNDIDVAILKLYELGVFKQIAIQYLGGQQD